MNKVLKRGVSPSFFKGKGIKGGEVYMPLIMLI
jgi:hypothetical protein